MTQPTQESAASVGRHFIQFDSSIFNPEAGSWDILLDLPEDE
jgi:hypothetical protein